MPQLVHARASHTRWGSFFSEGSGPFGASILLCSQAERDAVITNTWNAGRCAPNVTLTVAFDAPVTSLRLCPNMKPKDGRVGLVVTVLSPQPKWPASHAKIAHSELWREGKWVAIALPTPTSALRIEFMESPSWIALYGVEGI